jgi:hypothetical protein
MTSAPGAAERTKPASDSLDGDGVCRHGPCQGGHLNLAAATPPMPAPDPPRGEPSGARHDERGDTPMSAGGDQWARSVGLGERAGRRARAERLRQARGGEELADRDGILDRGARPLSFTGGRRRDPVAPAPVGSVPGRRGMCRGRAGAPHQPVAVGDGQRPRSRPPRLSSRCWWHSRWHSSQTDPSASGARQIPRSRNDL